MSLSKQVDVEPIFYGETDEEHEFGLKDLDLRYRLVYFSFGQKEGDIEPNYFQYSKKKGETEIQQVLMQKIHFLAKAEVVMPVQALMESLGVSNPLTVLNVLENLSNQDLIVNFNWPEL